jgi:hypothetical protein
LAISSMLFAVLITATVSPGEGLPVVRFVILPLRGAASAVAAHSIMQAGIRMLRSVLFELSTV